MGYKKYNEYKDSEVDWIGNIPISWEVLPLKYLANTIPGGTPSTTKEEYWKNGDIPWLPSGMVQNCNIFEEDVFKFITKEGLMNSATKYIGPNSVLIALTGATCGNIGFLTFKATANQSVISIEPYEVCSRFIYYYLLSQKEQILINKSGGAQGGINAENVRNIQVALMSINEQEKIVNFLDKKISEIDKNIAKNKEIINLLEEKKAALINQVVTKGLNPNVFMKDSGIKWIGEIPEHWDVNKLKEISEIKPSNVDKKSKEGEPSVFLCNYTDVYNNDYITNNLDFMEATASYDQINKLSLKKEDIIITKDSESADDIGVPAIVTEDLDNVVCGYHLAVIRPNENIHGKFLFRTFESKKINDQFCIAANGITRFGLSLYPIKNAYVCVPPLDEQKEISTYLENEIINFHEIINKINKQIGLLEEYKSSLIHHVVTGKIDIREEEI